jgi:hypothetical protein
VTVRAVITGLNFSTLRLTWAFFGSLACTIVFASKLRTLGPSIATDHTACLSPYGIAVAVAAYSVALTVTMLLCTKQFLVAREVAAEGPHSPSSRRVSFWDVPDMVQTRIGAKINFVILAVVFGADVYYVCVTSGRLDNFIALPRIFQCMRVITA